MLYEIRTWLITSNIFAQDVNGDPEHLINRDNPHTHIIAVGANKNEIQNYFICLEQNIICVSEIRLNGMSRYSYDSIFQVPVEFTFVDTLDMFMKCHHVFNVNFNPALKNTLSFIDFYCYANKAVKVTSQMIKVQKTVLPK